MTIDTDKLLDTFAVFRNLHFKVRESTLSDQVKQQLDDIASSLQDTQKTIIISGHTDIQPFNGVSPEESDRLNWKLSQERAVAIATALVKHCIPRIRMETRGYGYSQPAKGYSIEDWDKNLRVEIEVK